MRNLQADAKSETEILNYLAYDSRLYYEYNHLIGSKLFLDSFNKKVFVAIEEMIIQGEDINPLSVSRKINDLESIRKLVMILSYPDTGTSLKTHLMSLQERFMVMGLKRLSVNIDSKINNKADVFDIISDAQHSLSELQDIKPPANMKVSEHIHNLLRKIEENDRLNGISGVPTGFKDFDRFTAGLQGGNLIILAGATSMGKTAFALSFMRNQAVKYNLPCLYISREMTSLEITTRLTSMETKINSKKILSGRLNVMEHQQLSKNITALYNSNMYIDTDHKSHISNILSTIHAMHSSKGIKIAVVDYLQKLSYPNPKWNREHEVAEISWALQNKAKELNIPIVLLCQLSREVEKSKDCIPRLSNLRESGQIEQAADVVMFAYRPEYYGIKDANGNDQIGHAEIIIAKGRNIGTASIDLQFHAEYTEFTDKETYQEPF